MKDVDPDSLIERKPSIQSWIQSADMPQARPFTSTSGHDDDDHDDGDDVVTMVMTMTMVMMMKKATLDDNHHLGAEKLVLLPLYLNMMTI